MINDQFNITDTVTIKKAKKRALMLRVGGLGDCIILTPIAKELNKRGYSVDYFVGSPTGNIHLLLKGLDFFNDVKKVERLNGIDCIRDENEHYVSVDILKQGYDFVIDYKLSVEDNRSGNNDINDPWRNSVNSNFMNWVDLSLAWANIDWTKIEDDCKRPIIGLDANNDPWTDHFIWLANDTPIEPKIDRTFKVIGIQLQASSLTRSWYRAQELPEIIHKQFPDDVVLVFNGRIWIALSKFGKQEIKLDDNLDPLCASATLISQMDVFISADSGMSHISEALDIPTIAIYTTVPAWTRIKYYKYAYPIEATVSCHPCFVLDLFCPINKKEAESGLSEREKEIVSTVENNGNWLALAKKFSTVPRAIQVEYETTKKRVEALSAKMAACVQEITPEMILEKVKEVLNK